MQANGGTGHHESIVEVTNLVVLNEHSSLQPDLQYIANPGGRGGLQSVGSWSQVHGEPLAGQG